MTSSCLEFAIQRFVRGIFGEKNLSLEKTDEICCSHETMVRQIKVVSEAGLSIADAGKVNALSKKPKRGKCRRGRGSRNANTWGNSCEFCGREHDLAKHENCPAFGRSCNKCGKKYHFANICFRHAPKPRTRTHPVYCFEDELSDKVFGVEEISAVTSDDSFSAPYRSSVQCYPYASIQESH